MTNLKNYLNTHKKGALTLFVVALFAVGAMLLGRAGYLGNNLTGSMLGAKKVAPKQATQTQPSRGRPLTAMPTKIAPVTPATPILNGTNTLNSSACKNPLPITRIDLIRKLYAKTGDAGCNNIASGTTFDIGCSDIAPTSTEACMWKFLQNKGVVGHYADASGNSVGNCGSSNNVSRSEFAKITATFTNAGNGYAKPATPTYSDISPDTWFYDFVEQGVRMGYFGIMPNNLFNPSDLAQSCFVDETLSKITY